MQKLVSGSIQVWVVGELHDDKKLHWRADSDSELTKASASLSCRLSAMPLAGCHAITAGFHTPKSRRDDLVIASTGGADSSVPGALFTFGRPSLSHT